MKFFRLLFALNILVLASVLNASPSAKPEDRLRDLTAKQKALLTQNDPNDPHFDKENFRSQIQQLCDAYDLLIKDHPKFAASYVAYGMLLSQIDMRREAAIMFLNANKIDHNIPLVKNQLGNYLAEEGRPLEAVSYYLAAIKLDPKEPLYHYQLGQLLYGARDDFIKSGSWTREAVDHAMHEAFREAKDLAPDNLPYAYRYGESFADVDHPNWDEAFTFWKSIEPRAKPGIEKQTIELQEANVLIKENKFADAKTVLDSVDDQKLVEQKQKLIAQLPAPKSS
jgi:tetratricopeptide (TPR) repeat protein